MEQRVRVVEMTGGAVCGGESAVVRVCGVELKEAERDGGGVGG
jgi:hypothetical protein